MPVRPALPALLLTLAALLSACDAQRIERLEEGYSTEADVRRQFGEPESVLERADGSRRLAYPRQPEGQTNYLIEIGPDGKMSALRQLLTPANFERVQPGMSEAAVRELLGRPAKVWTFPTRPGEATWDWRFLRDQRALVFSVQFGPERTVTGTAVTEDTRGTDPGR